MNPASQAPSSFRVNLLAWIAMYALWRRQFESSVRVTEAERQQSAPTASLPNIDLDEDVETICLRRGRTDR
jgi:hypothetical protein